MTDQPMPDFMRSTWVTYRRSQTNTDVSHLVLWVDDFPDVCPRCGRSCGRDIDTPPISVDPDSNELQPLPAQHDCGYRLSQTFIDLIDPDESTIAEAIARLAREYEQGQDAEADRVRRRLRRELDDALSRLAAGTEVDDVTTGSEAEPGVWRRGKVWEAWDYDPHDDDLIITVTE